MAISIRERLIDNEAKIGIWGSGYIGFTSAINFALNGVRTICFDINSEVVKSINKGKVNIPNLDYWLGFSSGSLVKNGLLSATDKWQDLLKDEVCVHLIAVPTERNGEPWNSALKDVITKISQKKPTVKNPNLIIIESTLVPNETDEIVIKIIEDHGHQVGKEFLVGVAPRRDWFHSPEKNLKNLPRVIGGTTPKTSKIMKEVLGIVCDHLLLASDHKVVEMVKSVENSLLHIPSVYAMQLSRAYPEVDIKEVLKLASTHWRIPLYYPSMGTGGYCVPISSKYVNLGASFPEFLTITEEAIRWDLEQPKFIAQLINSKTKGKIGMLGITYKGDLKVHVLSPALAIIRYLKEMGREVYTHDPYYTSKELLKVSGVGTFSYPDDLSKFKAIIIVPEHRMYMQTPKETLFKNLHKGQIILDNVGTWEKFRIEFKKHGIIYHCIGDKNWCLW